MQAVPQSSARVAGALKPLPAPVRLPLRLKPPALDLLRMSAATATRQPPPEAAPPPVLPPLRALPAVAAMLGAMDDGMLTGQRARERGVAEQEITELRLEIDSVRRGLARARARQLRVDALRAGAEAEGSDEVEPGADAAAGVPGVLQAGLEASEAAKVGCAATAA